MRMISSGLLVLVLSNNLIEALSWNITAPERYEVTYTADEAEFERLRIDGNVALYNLDYGIARDAFKKMTELAPDHPAGHFYLANNLWLETLNSSRRLSSSLYSSASFYTKPAGDDKFDLKRDSQFNEYIKKAINVADARLTSNPKDAQSLYYKGAALGISAAYRVSVKRSFLAAIGEGKESIQTQYKVIKLDPNYTDAYMSIGFYEYVLGSLPLWHKIWASFVGIKGSKKTGIELLERVVNSGKYAQDDARVLLIGIYTRERRFEQAKALVDYLGQKYPRNYLLGIENAAMLYRLGRLAEGARAFEDLLKNQHTASVASDVVNYQSGEALLTEARNYILAIERYKAVIARKDSDKSLRTLAHLRVGQALDALGRHKEAVEEYNVVLGETNVYDSRELASKYREKPYVPSRK